MRRPLTDKELSEGTWCLKPVHNSTRRHIMWLIRYVGPPSNRECQTLRIEDFGKFLGISFQTHYGILRFQLKWNYPKFVTNPSLYMYWTKRQFASPHFVLPDHMIFPWTVPLPWAQYVKKYLVEANNE